MKVITREQRKAIKRLYDRSAPKPYLTPEEIAAGIVATPISYRQFRRSVHTGHDCLMVWWCKMWIGIEPDGHTHS